VVGAWDAVGTITLTIESDATPARAQTAESEIRTIADEATSGICTLARKTLFELSIMALMP
jgi:hypothetical protein